MPHYEYVCHACKTSFSKTFTPVEYEEGDRFEQPSPVDS